MRAERRWRDWALGSVLLLALLAWVQVQIGWAALLAPWRAVAPAELLGLLALSALSYLLRGIRLYDYFHGLMRGHLLLTLRLSILHNVANNLLPMRTGEAVFPLLMKRYFGHGYVLSALSLLWIRLLDLQVLGQVALLAGWFAAPHWAWPVLMALSWAAIPLFYVQRHRLAGFAAARGRGGRWAGRVFAVLGSVAESLPDSPARLARVYLWTLLSWASKLVAFVVILRHFLEAELWQAFVGIIGAELSSVLPFHGIAGSGSYELAMVLAITPTGIDATAALAGAVNLHLFLLGVTLLLGGLGLLLPRHRG